MFTLERINMSKLLATILVTICSVSAFAADTPSRGVGDGPRMSPEQRASMREDMRNFHESHPLSQEHFEQLKKMNITHLQKHIAQSQEALSCIQASTTPDAFKACKEKEHAARKAEHEERKEFMGKMRDRMQERRADRGSDRK